MWYQDMAVVQSENNDSETSINLDDNNNDNYNNYYNNNNNKEKK